MTTTPLKKATTKDAASIIDSLVLAFSSDPAARWLYPQAQQHLRHFPSFIQAFGCQAFEAGTAYAIEDDSGAALWLSPDTHPDDQALEALLKRTVSPDQETVFAVFEQMGHYHPSTPHWYLAVLGVEPTQQRKGYGSALIKPVLAQCDGLRPAGGHRDGQLAYLESSNPANIPFYEHHGFELLGTIQIGASPPIMPMVRYPH